jgi:signal transduction histidine kinase/CHASE3 domain sensor protein
MGKKSKSSGLRIGIKLALAFGVLVILVFVMVGLAYNSSSQAISSNNLTKDERAPALLAASAAQVDLLRLQSSIRAYLIFGDEASRAEFDDAQNKLNEAFVELETTLDSPELLEELQSDFDEVLNVAGTMFTLRKNPMQNEPAQRILAQDAAYSYASILESIAEIVSIQKDRSATSQHAEQLVLMTDFQRTFALMNSSLRRYVETGDSVHKFDYEAFQAENEAAWNKLVAERDFLEREQRNELDNIIRRQQILAPLPQEMFDVIEGDRTRVDLYLFQTEFLPLINDMQQELDTVVANQTQLLEEQLATSSQTLGSTQTQILIGGAIALLLGVGLAVAFQRSMALPIRHLTETAVQVRDGDLSVQAPVETNDEIGTLARVFNSMTRQLRELIESLEDRVQDRTQRLETVATMGEQLNSILSLDELLQELVNQTQEKFEYYQVQVYLVSDGFLILTSASGAANTEKMIIEGHQIPINAESSLAAKAARSANIVWVEDVHDDADWLANPLLPDTASEMAVPIILDDHVVGILDVQSDDIASFDDADANLFRFLANQAAVAINNAKLFSAINAARQDAETASQFKTQFLSNMSHELRTPLNAIINMTGFVADGVMGEVNEDQVDALNKTVDSGQHLLSLINDVLDLTKIEAGMMNIIFEDVDLEAVLNSVMSSGKGLVKNKPIDLISDFPAEGLPHLLGDKRRIRQILLNILSNSVKYTIEGEIIVSARVKENNVHISIQDTGIGIADHDYPRVFETFTQASNSLDNVVSTGLGLPITKQLVELHGGEIWFESEVGSGSIFHVLLPVSPPISDNIVVLDKAKEVEQTI